MAGIAAASVVSCALAACSNDAPKKNSALEASYAIKDSAASGSAVLRRNDVIIDTVDVAFGVQRVGHDSVVFMPLSSRRHVLFDGASRTEIRTIVPDFDDGFSAPSVIDGALLYWGIRRNASGIADSIRAIRFEFGRKRLNPIPVAPARLDTVTKNRFYFTPPYLDKKEIVFKAPSGEWRFRTPKQ